MIGLRSHDFKSTRVSASKAFALPLILVVSEHQSPQACLEVSIPAPSRLVDSEPSKVVSFRGHSGLVSMFEDHQFSSVAQSCLSFAIPWTAACQASLSITGSQSLLKLISITSVMPPNHLILCLPFSAHEIFQARVLEWGAIAFSVSCAIWLLFLPEEQVVAGGDSGITLPGSRLCCLPAT